MKNVFYILAGGLLLINCNKTTEKAQIHNPIKLQKINKLFVVGNFDNVSGKDTISQHIYSKLGKSEIENGPNPFQNDFDKVSKWFYEQDAILYLTINKNKQDSLHLETAQGLYCLINIGDNNFDRKDEIAFVIDKLDQSRVNSCNIYTFCNDKWQLLKQFEINEEAFDFTTDIAPIFSNIKNYLEKQNNKWYFAAYSPDNNIPKKQLLKLEKCK